MFEQKLSEMINEFVEACESTKPVDEELMIIHLHVLSEDDNLEDDNVSL